MLSSARAMPTLACCVCTGSHRYGRLEVGVRGHQGPLETRRLTLWHQGDLLHVIAQQVAQSAAHRQGLIHVAQAQRAHHLKLLFLRPVRHVSLQPVLLLRIVPQQLGRQFAGTPAGRASQVSFQSLPSAGRETEAKAGSATGLWWKRAS